MGALHKHGFHEIQLSLQDIAAGSANDTGDMYTWMGNVSNLGVVDSDQYQIRTANLAFRSNQNGQATNFFSAQFTVYSGGGGGVAAGTIRHQLSFAFSANTAPPNATKGVFVDLSGPASTFLTFPAGDAVGLPWNIFEGDSFAFERISNNATGLASVGMGITVGIGKAGA